MIFQRSRLTTDDSRPKKKGYPGYGFGFWLGWIILFAGGCAASAAGWTAVIRAAFGEIKGAELTFTWAAAVFGTWFLLVIPFMRKKERIWKRLNLDEENAVDAWLLAMGSTVAAMAASTFVWTWILKERAAVSAGFDGLWLKAVAGSFLAALVPLLVFMYRKADSLFRTAERRQSGAGLFHSAFVQLSDRVLPGPVAAKLAEKPPLMPGGHIVTAVLRDGRRIPNVFVRNRSEILGVYGRTELGFSAVDVVGLEVVNKEELPVYKEEKWLRVDLFDGAPKGAAQGHPERQSKGDGIK